MPNFRRGLQGQRVEKSDIFDDMIRVIRQSGELNGGLVYLNPENRRAFFAAAEKASAPSAPEPVPPSRPVAAASPAPYAPPAAAASVRDLSRMSLDELAATVSGCRLCRLCEQRTQTVFGDGNPQAELMFIGEGPGKDEDQQGLPFVGAAGQLLTKMIAAMQFDRREVYIANVVKCRPPGNRNPEPDEAGTCLPYLRRQIELIKPKVIVLLGAIPLKYLLGKTSITRERGRWDEFMGVPVMPTYHPAYLLRFEAGKKEAWSDLQQVMKKFGKVYTRQG